MGVYIPLSPEHALRLLVPFLLAALNGTFQVFIWETVDHLVLGTMPSVRQAVNAAPSSRGRTSKAGIKAPAGTWADRHAAPSQSNPRRSSSGRRASATARPRSADRGSGQAELSPAVSLRPQVSPGFENRSRAQHAAGGRESHGPRTPRAHPPTRFSRCAVCAQQLKSRAKHKQAARVGALA